MTANDDFKRGFEEGYKSVAGDLVLGSTPFREGIKAGIKAAGGLDRD